MRSGSVRRPWRPRPRVPPKGEITTAKALVALLGKVIPPDARFREEFAVATVSAAHFARYYLRSLEMATAKDPEPFFIPNDDQSVINLEHVLPEKPCGNWPQFYRRGRGGVLQETGEHGAAEGEGRPRISTVPPFFGEAEGVTANLVLLDEGNR